MLFEKAKFTMETKGDIEGAIKLFSEIIKKYPDEREYAAKSQLYIGLCYEKRGMEEAKKAFQKVIDTYPEQADVVKKAREKLGILLNAQAILGKEDREFTMRKVVAGPAFDVLGEVSPDGQYICYTDWDSGDIGVRDLAAEKNSRLSNKGSWMKSSDFALFSVWSPCSKKVACNWYNAKDNIFDLRIYGFEGSEAHILYNKSEYTHPLDWSSDEKQILIYIHICGNSQPILEMLADTGADAVEPLDPLGGVSLEDAKTLIGGRVALMGGLNTLTLVRGTVEEVRAEAIKKCRQGGPHGYILAAGDMVPPATPRENLRAMVEVARESLWQ